MKAANHFSEREWADFVRDIAQEAERSAMDQHLSDGCVRCRQVVEVLRRFAPIASREASYEPSEQTVRRAEAVFQRPPHAPISRVIRGSVTARRRLAGKTPARVGI